MNEQLETMLLKRHVTDAALLLWNHLFFSKRVIILNVIVSLAFVLFLGGSSIGHRFSFTGWALGFLLLISLWAVSAVSYLVLRVRNLSRLKLCFNQPVKYELNNDLASVHYPDGLRGELLWTDVTKYIKSSEVTVLYAAVQKKFIFFPNTILSEKIETHMLEAVGRNQNVPPVITKSAPAGESRKKYLGVAVIVIVLILYFAFILCCHNRIPLPSDLGK